MRRPAARLLACALTGLLCGLLPVRAQASASPTAPPSPSAAAARAAQQLEHGDFESAVRTLTQGLEEPALSVPQRVELARLLGLAELSLGHEAKARAAYRHLLELDPGYQLTASTPPKVRSLFEQAGADLAGQKRQGTLLTLEPLEEVSGDLSIPLSIRVQPPLTAGGRLRFSYRRAQSLPFNSFDLVPSKDDPELYSGSVPGYEVPTEAHAYDVEYFVDALDPRGHPLASRGSALVPLLLHVRAAAAGGLPRSPEPGRDTAWYERPWVWVVGGALLVGTAAGVYALASAKAHPSMTLRFQVKAL